MALGGEQSRGGERPGDRVPGGKQVVERHRHVARAGRPGKARGRVDGVVHCGAAVVVAHDVHHHEVAPYLRELVVPEPATRGKVGQEEARLGTGRADEPSQQLLAARGAQVHLNRALALVEAGPEEAHAFLGDRPAGHIETAADRVEADHVGAELGERHPAEGRGHEGRALDHSHPVEDAAWLAHAISPKKRQSSTGVRSPLPSRSAAVTARRSTNPPASSG